MKRVKSQFDDAKLESQSDIHSARSGSRGCLFGTAHTTKEIVAPILHAIESEPASIIDARKKRRRPTS